jgi:hypothetical protein
MAGRMTPKTVQYDVKFVVEPELVGTTWGLATCDGCPLFQGMYRASFVQDGKPCIEFALTRVRQGIGLRIGSVWVCSLERLVKL